MKYKSINYLNDYFKDIINDECSNVIEKLGENYNLSEKEKLEYIENIKESNEEKIKDFVDTNVRCLGLIKSGEQCARSRSNGKCYCKIHQKTLKFGRKIII